MGLLYCTVFIANTNERGGVSVRCVLNVLASAQIMEKAAKVPASPCPLMIGVVYEAGSIPASPNKLP